MRDEEKENGRKKGERRKNRFDKRSSIVLFSSV